MASMVRRLEVIIEIEIEILEKSDINYLKTSKNLPLPDNTICIPHKMQQLC